MKRKKTSVIKPVAILLTACFLTLASLSFTGCRLDFPFFSQGEDHGQSDGQNTNTNAAVVTTAPPSQNTNGGGDNSGGTSGGDGDVIIDTEGFSLAEVYETACTYGYEGSFLDFVSEYFGVEGAPSSGNDVTRATATALLSAVSVAADSSAGSGVIYRLDREAGDAYVITNYHVVYDEYSRTGIADSIAVYLYGMEYTDYEIPATYVGGSMTYDIAVLRISDSDVLRESEARAVTVADSNTVAVGMTAIAVGNPESGGISATSGIVSVDSETITMTSVDNSSYIDSRVIRIDTPVNPGNSGGGLFDGAGNLIGIVNAKISSSDVENIGYAIPANIAKYVADSIIDEHEETGSVVDGVSKCLMGISIIATDVRAEWDEESGAVLIYETVEIQSVEKGSLAYGTLQEGDVLLTSRVGDNELEVTRSFVVVDQMLSCRVGDSVTVTVDRDGEICSFTLYPTKNNVTVVP